MRTGPHLTKTIAYGSLALLDSRAVLLGLALTRATILGTATGKRLLQAIGDRTLVVMVEIGLLAAGLMFVTGVA